MRLTENRRLGAAAVVLCALISVLALGGWKLHARHSALERIFVYGTEPRLMTRHSMDAYLDRCAQSASDLAQEAKRHSVDDALIETALSDADALTRTDGIDGRYETYRSLTRAVEEIYTALQAAGAQDAVNVTVAYHDYRSAQNLIQNDGYHAEASAYNEAVRAFPARAIASIWRLEPAETYGR